MMNQGNPVSSRILSLKNSQYTAAYISNKDTYTYMYIHIYVYKDTYTPKCQYTLGVAYKIIEYNLFT